MQRESDSRQSEVPTDREIPSHNVRLENIRTNIYEKIKGYEEDVLHRIQSLTNIIKNI